MLPAAQGVCHAKKAAGKYLLVVPLVHCDAAHKAQVHAKAPVPAGAVDAEEDAEIDRGPVHLPTVRYARMSRHGHAARCHTRAAWESEAMMRLPGTHRLAPFRNIEKGRRWRHRKLAAAVDAPVVSLFRHDGIEHLLRRGRA